ncbi:hypothetical protein GF318_05070 [Candidatus Micrarchaeota archaeon]|nr:hypothetical protein [Candidatus Micrarchaeota archaeon]
MDVKHLMGRAKRVKKSKNPFAKARRILLDSYRQSLKSGSRIDRLRFELVRSMVVQKTYEAMGPGDRWLGIAKVKAEMHKAREKRRKYLEDGNEIFSEGFLFEGDPELNRIRLELDREANSYWRFLGSFRTHIPGLGYAVTVKKTRGLNQDSCLLYGKNGERAMALADGCSTERFSSAASYLAMKKLRENIGALLIDPRGVIRDISQDISGVMVLGMKDMYMGIASLGSTTILAGIPDGSRKSVYKFGDSYAFVQFDYEGKTMVERVGHERALACIAGQPCCFEDCMVEEHIRKGRKLILTSDGITNPVARTNRKLAQFYRETPDSIIVAERITRLAIMNSLKTGKVDDMTVVIEE